MRDKGRRAFLCKCTQKGHDPAQERKAERDNHGSLISHPAELLLLLQLPPSLRQLFSTHSAIVSAPGLRTLTHSAGNLEESSHAPLSLLSAAACQILSPSAPPQVKIFTAFISFFFWLLHNLSGCVFFSRSGTSTQLCGSAVAEKERNQRGEYFLYFIF